MDRRGSGRLPFIAAVRQEAGTLPGGGEPPAFALHLSQARNLGLCGMQVRRRAHAAEGDLPARTRLRLCFQLPDGGQLLRLHAEVVFDRQEERDAPYRLTGLRFADLPEETAARLRSFIGSMG